MEEEQVQESPMSYCYTESYTVGMKILNLSKSSCDEHFLNSVMKLSPEVESCTEDLERLLTKLKCAGLSQDQTNMVVQVGQMKEQ